MKLDDIIRHICPIESVVIYCDRENEPVYEGFLLDLPWYLLDYYLDSNEEYEAIHSFYNKENNSNGLVINLIENYCDEEIE